MQIFVCYSKETFHLQDSTVFRKHCLICSTAVLTNLFCLLLCALLLAVLPQNHSFPTSPWYCDYHPLLPSSSGPSHYSPYSPWQCHTQLDKPSPWYSHLGQNTLQRRYGTVARWIFLSIESDIPCHKQLNLFQERKRKKIKISIIHSYHICFNKLSFYMNSFEDHFPCNVYNICLCYIWCPMILTYFSNISLLQVKSVLRTLDCQTWYLSRLC